jgi:signal transduction histidine kinase
MAESYLQQRKFRKGLVTALMALATAQDMQNLSLYHSIQLLLGRIYLEKGNPDAAEGYLKDVVTFAENNASVARLSKAHELLAVLYARRDDYQKAYQHQGLFMHYKSQLFNAEKAKIMERMETRLLIEQKEHAYQLLQASSLQQEENLAFELNKNYAETAIIVLALLLAATLGISYRKSRKLAGRLYSQKKHIEAQHDEISQQNLRIREQNDLLEQQNQELAELNREKDTIMSMVAHDLKSPLNRLNGLSELLIMARQEPQEQEKYASLIKETSQEGVSLVHELLDQKIGQQNPLAGMQAIDLSQLLRQIGLQQQDAALAKRIRLLIECPDGLSLWTDRKALKRIIDNLLSNAIKYSFTDTVVELKGKQLGDDIEIIIADQGPGFTEEDKANLYQQYQQLSAKPTRGESSHGLGLSIVKNLVDKMRGRLLLESEAGIGSTFRVILSQQA